MAESFDGAGILLLPYDVAERLWFDEWWYRGEPSAGLLVEISHLTISDADALLDRLLIDHEPDPSLLTFAAALAFGRRLAGEAAQLTGRVADYPQPLAAAVVRTLGQIDHFWRWQMYRDRNDPHGLRIHYATVVTAITHMVCALNRRWWPGPKWPAWILADLAISPPDLARRLLRLDTLAPAAAARELQQLVEDCYTLAETHLPEGEPQRLREIFRFARQPWPAPDAPADRPSVRLEVDQYTGDDGDRRFAPSRTAHWTGGHAVAPPDPEQLRALHWARQAITASAHRTQAAIGDAAASWQCAVEGVWWVSALDDLFWRLVASRSMPMPVPAMITAGSCSGSAGSEACTFTTSASAAPAAPRRASSAAASTVDSSSARRTGGYRRPKWDSSAVRTTRTSGPPTTSWSPAPRCPGRSSRPRRGSTGSTPRAGSRPTKHPMIPPS